MFGSNNNPTGVRAFGQAMLAHWSTRMSGPLSVPAAIAALFIENNTAQLLLGLTAFICVWAAAYGMWKSEREKSITTNGWTLGQFLKKRDRFTIKEAACLLAAAPFPQGELTGVAVGYLNNLENDILAGNITVLNDQGHEIEMARMRRRGLAIMAHDTPSPLRDTFEISKETLSVIANAADIKIGGVNSAEE